MDYMHMLNEIKMKSDEEAKLLADSLWNRLIDQRNKSVAPFAR